MAHPYHVSHAEKQEKAHDLVRRTGHKLAAGGRAPPDVMADEKLISSAIHQHEDHEHGGKRTKLKFKQGGTVEGEHAKHHLGKRARGGPTGKKGGHVTNVIVAPQGGGGMRPPMAGQQPAMPRPVAPPPRPVAPPPPRPAGPPPGMAPGMAGPGGPPGGPPGGMPPGVMKRGGKVKHRRAAGGAANREDHLREDEMEDDNDEAGGSDNRAPAEEGGSENRRASGGRAGQSHMRESEMEHFTQERGANERAHRGGMTSGGREAFGKLTPGYHHEAEKRVLRRQKEAIPEADHYAQDRARGGRTNKHVQETMEAGVPSEALMQSKRGGEVHVKAHMRRSGGHVPDIEAGGGGGEGRIRKMREYGEGRGFTPRDRSSV